MTSKKETKKPKWHSKPFEKNPWTYEDIVFRIEYILGKGRATKENCEYVAERINDNFDANYGVNWDVIDDAVGDLRIELDYEEEESEDENEA